MPLLHYERHKPQWGRATDPRPLTTLEVVLGLSALPEEPGNCYGKGNLMFPTSNQAAYEDLRRICADCPIQTACLAMGMDEPHGMWGGLTPAERRALPRTSVA